MENNETPTFGVWIPGQGWLKAGEGQFPQFADHSREKAEQVARYVGQGAQVRFIDKSIVELERLYLDSESRSTWQRFRNYFKPKNSK